MNRNKKLPLWKVLGGIFLLCLLVVTGESSSVIAAVELPAEEGVYAGSQAPDFSLPDLEGKSHKLSDYRGKIVLLNFWATWCPPCRAEMPSMEQLQGKLSRDDFVIVAVGTDDGGRDTLKSFVERYRYTFQVLVDPSGLKLMRKFQLSGLPTTFILDREGVIRERLSGGMEWDNKEVISYFQEMIQATSSADGKKNE